METRVLVRSSRKPNAINPPPQWCFWWNLIMIGQLVSEILMFESVDGRTEGRTHGRRLESHTIISPWAFGFGELKIRGRTPLQWGGGGFHPPLILSLPPQGLRRSLQAYGFKCSTLNSKSSKLLWLSLLPARMKKIHSKMKALESSQHYP